MKALLFFVAALLFVSPAYALIAGGCTGCVNTGGGTSGATIPEMVEMYLLRQILVVASFYIAGYFLGRIVQKGKMSASLSRKMICVLTFAISFANSLSVSVGGILVTCGMIGLGCVILLLMMGSLSSPFRTRIPFLNTVFAAINRPEDVPYTLHWLSTEAVATSAITALFVPIFAYVTRDDVAQAGVFYHLMLVPIFASGIGDALAEIVGKRWGRHQYTTHPVFGHGQTYTRSYEGSAMVFLTTVVVGLIAAGLQSFSVPLFFWQALILLPFTLTLAEAKAPHTWDNPLIYLTGYLTIIAVMAS